MASQKQETDILNAAEGTLKQAIQQYFSDAHDVEVIFLAKRSNHFYIRVITNHEQFDREASHLLYSREDMVRDALDGVLLDFDYIPRLGRTLESLRPHRAIAIIQKER